LKLTPCGITVQMLAAHCSFRHCIIHTSWWCCYETNIHINGDFYKYV